MQNMRDSAGGLAHHFPVRDVARNYLKSLARLQLALMA
jgi:hypothetical protein